MSLQFNDTATDEGVIQRIEDHIGFNRGEISGNPVLLKKFTADANQAKFALGQKIQSIGGRWQHDDTNFADYPLFTSDIVASQPDYFFDVDEDGNQIQDIYRVLIRTEEGGDYQTCPPVDRQSEDDTDSFSNSVLGIPLRHDKFGNAVFLDPIPNYDADAGIMIMGSREASRYLITDSTKGTGFDGRVDEFIPLHAAYPYARTHGLPQKNDLRKDLEAMDMVIKQVYGKRERSHRRRMVMNVESNK